MTRVIVTLAILFLCIIGGSTITSWATCSAKGGAFVRSIFGYACVRAYP